MPSGRDVVEAHNVKLPMLGADTVAKMRAPLDQDEINKLESEIARDSDDEANNTNIPGAFPESTGVQSSSYY